MKDRRIVDLRRVGIDEVPMIGRYDYAQAQRGLPQHAHAGALEICYLARGQQMYRVGRQDFVLTGGDLFMTFPGETHSTGEAPQEKGRLYWIILLVPQAKQRRWLNCAGVDGPALADRLLGLPHRHFAGEPAIGRVFDEILDLSRQRHDPLHRLALQNRLIDLLLRVIACAGGPARPAVSPPISELLRYIEGHLEDALALPALAARVGLSLPRFKSRFRQEVGIPPADYVLRCKIGAAKQRLAATDVSVTDVAFDLGFSSSQYFATVFRRYTRQTPGQYRTTAGANRPATSRSHQ